MKVQVLPGGLTCRQLPDRPRPSSVDFSFITDGHELYQMAVDKWESEAASMPVYDLQKQMKEGEVVEVELKEVVVHGKVVRDDSGFSIGGEQVVETIAIPIDRKQHLIAIMHEDEKDGLYDTAHLINMKHLQEDMHQTIEGMMGRNSKLRYQDCANVFFLAKIAELETQLQSLNKTT